LGKNEKTQAAAQAENRTARKAEKNNPWEGRGKNKTNNLGCAEVKREVGGAPSRHLNIRRDEPK